MTIKSAHLKPILNSLGEWTIEVTFANEANTASASVPKGKSEGKYEAKAHDLKQTIKNFAQIKQQILSTKYNTIKDFDSFLIELDGTKNKSNLGGNLTLALSIAYTKLLAKSKNIPTYQLISTEAGLKPNIPNYQLLIFEGGKHGSQFITSQEYMLIENNIFEAQKIISATKRYLDDNNLFVGFGLEGAFTSSKLDDIDVLNLINRLFPNKKIAIDVAQSSRQGDNLDFKNIIDKYNIHSIEDPKSEEDYKGWSQFYKDFSQKIVVVGDDLTTTNTTLINNAYKQKMANGVIIKPNQVGTIYETILAVKMAKKYNWEVIVSHRGGDTNDNFLADLAVGVGANNVKFGGLQRGERLAKYNRLEEIKRKGI